MDHIYQLSKHLTKFYPRGNDWDWGKHTYRSYNEGFEILINGIKLENMSDMKSLIKDLSIKSHDLKKNMKEQSRNNTSPDITGYLNIKYILRHLFLAYADLRNVPRSKLERKTKEYSDWDFKVHLKRKEIPEDINDSLKIGINETFIKELTSSIMKEHTDAN